MDAELGGCYDVKVVKVKPVEFVGMHARGTLLNSGQAIIINKDDYLDLREQT